MARKDSKQGHNSQVQLEIFRKDEKNKSELTQADGQNKQVGPGQRDWRRFIRVFLMFRHNTSINKKKYITIRDFCQKVTKRTRP